MRPWLNIGEVLSDRFEEQIRKNAIEEGARKLSLYLEKKKKKRFVVSAVAIFGEPVLQFTSQPISSV